MTRRLSVWTILASIGYFLTLNSCSRAVAATLADLKAQYDTIGRIDLYQTCHDGPKALPQSSLTAPDCDHVDANIIASIIRGVVLAGGILEIKGAVVVGQLDLRSTRILPSLVFRNIKFLDGVLLDDSNLSGELVFDSVSLSHGLSAQRLKTGGSLVVGQTSIDGDFDISSSRVTEDIYFNNSSADSLLLYDAQASDLYMKSSRLSNRLKANNLHVVKNMVIDDSTINDDLVLDQAKIDGDVRLSRIRSLGVQAEDLSAGGSLLVSGVSGDTSDKHRGTLDLRRARVEHSTTINYSSFYKVDLSRYYNGADFDVQNLEVRNQFDCQRAVIKGEFLLDADSNIGNDKNTSERSMQSVDLSYTEIGGNIAFGRTSFNFLGMRGLRVGGLVELSKTKLKSLDLANSKLSEGLVLSSTLTRSSTSWGQNGFISLESSDLGTIFDDRHDLDAWPQVIRFSGFAFQRFLPRKDAAWYVNWLNRDANNTAQSFDEVSSFLKRIGREDDGDFVAYAAKDKQLDDYVERCYQFKLTYCSSAIGMGFVRSTIGYGIGQARYRVFFWIGLLGLLGALVLRTGANELKWAGRGPIWCIGASLNQLLPIVELNKEFKDFFNDPERQRLRNWQLIYFGLHAILGSLLASYLVTTFAQAAH